jgi:5'-nucleotidase (lipoprotein e(P4) family)
MACRFITTAFAVALLSGCASTSNKQAQISDITPTAKPSAAVSAPAVAADDNLNAVAWSQTAIEHDLIYLQTYRDAGARLLPAMHDTHWDALSKGDRIESFKNLPPAVILDIDETVLDNSPYQARVIRSGGEFNEADWAAWCREAKASAMPGAVAFTQFAASHGIAVIYISNRAKDLDQVTLLNLRNAGFPVSGPQAFLGLGTVVDGCEQAGSEKGCRRQLVSHHYRVLMQFGDQLGDFLDVPTNTLAGRRNVVAPYLPWIGTRWFVLPNPTYGSWESALFNNDYSGSREQRRIQKVDALRYQ